MSLKEQLIDAIRKGNNKKVSNLLDRMDVSAVNERTMLRTEKRGIAALHAACQQKNYRALTLLLAKSGIDVNVKSTDQNTPLHYACFLPSNDQTVSKLLAIPGIDVNVQNSMGHTPLHVASLEKNHQSVAKLLAIPGIDINVVDSLGATPLHYSCQENNDPAAASLLLATPGIDVNVQNICGSTPLHFACQLNSQAAARLLATPGIHVNVKNDSGRTPVMDAAEYRREEAFKLLLHDHRVDLDIKDNEGRGLEEAVGLWVSSKKYINLIKEERMKRGNVQNKEVESIGIVVEKIEKINNKIEDSKKRLTGILEKQKVEREKLARKHQEEKTEQEKIFTREAESNRRHMTDLAEMKNELARDLEKIHFDKGKSNDANNNDEKLKAACRALECPICLEYMKPPKKIWMCLRSHAICEACKILLEGKPCPTCTPRRTPSWVNLRAYTTEKMAKIVFD